MEEKPLIVTKTEMKVSISVLIAQILLISLGVFLIVAVMYITFPELVPPYYRGPPFGILPILGVILIAVSLILTTLLPTKEPTK